VQAIEKFAENVAHMKTSLTRLCRRLHDTEFPNDVAQTESLRAEHVVMRQEFSEDLESTVHHGDALRDCLADDDVKHRTELRQDRLEHVDAVDRYDVMSRGRRGQVRCYVTWSPWTGMTSRHVVAMDR